jgi:hypothetical protein
MKSIRTPISVHHRHNFRLFLDNVDLQEVIIGDYIGTYPEKFICYAYSTEATEIVAILTYITLKYGNIHTAFDEYIYAVMTSTMIEHNFNWTP